MLVEEVAERERVIHRGCLAGSSRNGRYHNPPVPTCQPPVLDTRHSRLRGNDGSPRHRATLARVAPYASLASSQRWSDCAPSRDGRPASNPSMLTSSSRSGQWTPSPSPMSLQLRRSSASACRSRGNHARGAAMPRPSARVAVSALASTSTPTAQGALGQLSKPSQASTSMSYPPAPNTSRTGQEKPGSTSSPSSASLSVSAATGWPSRWTSTRRSSGRTTHTRRTP